MPLFCFIHGIHAYETREYLPDTMSVLCSLSELLSDSGGAEFKSLVLSPRPTQAVRTFFDASPWTLLELQQPRVVQGSV